MPEIKYAFSNFDIIVVVDGRAHTVGLSHVNYLAICKSLQAGEYEKAVELLDVKKAVEKVYADKGLAATVTEDKVGNLEFEIEGHKLTGEIAQVFAAFKNAKLPFAAIIKFWKKFMANAKLGGEADYVRRQDLLRFLVRNKLVLTPDGNFIAFKGVRRSLEGHEGPYPSQYKHTFLYYLNKPAVEPAAKEITDIHVACGVGLHAGSIGFAKSYGDLRLAVEIDPRDVVTVPSNNDDHLRCWRLTPRVINPNDSVPVSHFLRLDTPAVVKVTEDATSGDSTTVATSEGSYEKPSVIVRLKYPGPHKILAIKVIRENMGLSLADAKTAVENPPFDIKVSSDSRAVTVLETLNDAGADCEILGSSLKPSQAKAKKRANGGRTKKTTWYKVVDGKIVRQRKVLCPGDGWSAEMPKTHMVQGEVVKTKVVTPKGAEVMRTYYRVIPGKPESCNVETTRASKCPPGWTGTRPPWFSKKKK